MTYQLAPKKCPKSRQHRFEKASAKQSTEIKKQLNLTFTVWICTHCKNVTESM